jgi:hypothetical protein
MEQGEWVQISKVGLNIIQYRLIYILYLDIASYNQVFQKLWIFACFYTSIKFIFEKLDCHLSRYCK